MNPKITIFVLIATAASFAQPAPRLAFEAASIKPSNAPRGPQGQMFEGEDVRTSPGNLTMENVTVASCLKWAYKIQDTQIAGPDWIRHDRFTIAAKAASPAVDSQLRAMLQTLLAERFKVALHRDSKTIAGYSLVVAKNGPKLTPSSTDGAPEMRGRLKWIATRYSMADLADFLADNTQSLVVDMTGLGGQFDFALDLGPYFSIDTPIRKDEAGPVLAAAFQPALQAQLGLKLESKKIPVEVLVIDHVEKPSEN